MQISESQITRDLCARLCKHLAALSLLPILLLGCASQTPAVTPQLVSIDSLVVTHQFGPRPDIPDAQAIHQLAPAQIADFRNYLRKPAYKFNPIDPVHKRVATYLQEFTSHFSYDERTLTAEEAYAERSGNCMSLAVLTTALAQIANVEVGYQLMNEAPVFQWRGDLLLNGQHLRSVLFNPKPISNESISMSAGILIDYFPTEGSRFVRRVGSPEYLSMFYNNLAVQALAEQDYRQSYWLLREALSQLPNNGDTLNTLALLFRRTGNSLHAERIYKASLQAIPNSVVMLRNYRSLLQSQNRSAEAQAITTRLRALDEVSPIDWLRAGTTEYLTGNYPEAARYFRKALGIAPYLHEANLGLAQTYFAMNDNENTRRQLEQALENAQRRSARSLYQAKLNALDRLSDHD